MADSLLDTRFRNFPVPALDDRQFDDLMEELLALIPVYCPEWSWHAPADPGITLLELFAYLTDVMLYRVNHMPVRHLFAVLNLLGIQPLTPACARTQLVIQPSSAAHGKVLRAGTLVSALLPLAPEETEPSAGGLEAENPSLTGDGPVLFETEQDLILSTARIEYVLTSSGSSTRDLSDWLETRETPLAPFGGTQGLERFIYLNDRRFLTLREPGMRVHLKFEGPSAHRDLYARWSWQYHNGDDWQKLPLAVSHDAGEVVLLSAPELAEVALPESAGVPSGPWLRAAPLPGEEEPAAIAFRDLHLEVESAEEGVLPTAIFLNTGEIFASLDVTRSFYPLGEQPEREATLYILARELFRAAGTRVELHFSAPPAERHARPDPSPDLELALEYGLPGGRWGLLRTLTPNPFIQSSESRHAVSDETRALKRGGLLTFEVPEDLTPRTLQGMEGPWIRLRLVQGQYRAPLETQQDVPDPTAIPGLRPFTGASQPPVGPLFQSLLLRSRAPTSPVAQVLSYSDFTWMPLWSGSHPRGTTVHPFPAREAYTTALYLGFSQPFPAGLQRIFVKVAAQEEALSAAYEAKIAEQQVRWEILTQDGFIPLPQLDDQTLFLKRDGYVSFQARTEWGRTTLFEREAVWIRARLVAGRYELAPVIQDILTNVVDVIQGETWREDRYLPSDGQPYQEVQLARAPVLAPVRVWVWEREAARNTVELRMLRQRLGEDAFREEDGGLWVRWEHVEQLGLASATSRCFAVDAEQGLIRFGDGRHGKVPPAGPRIIHIVSYRLGGGPQGNVAAHTLQTLQESNSLVDFVDNPFPAEGGAEAESLNEAALRGTRRLYQSDRAYRAEDYEHHARQASGRIARAHCLPPRAVELPRGERRAGRTELETLAPLRLVVIPRLGRDPQEQRLLPGEELLARVRHHLEARRSLNVRLEVQPPRYVSFSVRISLYLRGRFSPGTEEDLQQRLRRYLHPLTGGEAGQGWPLGAPVRRSALFQVLAGSPQVLSVLDVQLVDRHGEVLEGVLSLEDDQLPALTAVRVEVATLR